MVERTGIPLERLDLEAMASGNRALRLTEQVAWEAFPSYARVLVSALGGTIAHQADSAAERVWIAHIRGGAFWVSFDDFGLGVSLDPQNEDAGQLVDGIRETLLALRDRQGAG
jgi:hypothetical protein